ncbi:hypothetical protein F5I97DRAFT_1887538 [Phlebopus sp. FC_14]|nr:hypothetical protein F5I97DRAFT_1887538 [Phlebopus sp. FC_14]
MTSKGIKSRNVNELLSEIAAIAESAAVLRKSRLLHLLQPGQLRDIGKLRRRLAKVCQYFQGILAMFKTVRQLFPNGISHRWVNTIQHQVQAIRLANNYKDPLLRLYNGKPPTELKGMKPDMQKRWSGGRNIETRLHAEIRIVLDLVCSLDVSNQPGQQPIGCSKRSCLCCYIWIQAYNKSFKQKFLTSGSHGKPYPAWTLPGRCSNHVSSIDQVVANEVSKRLKDTLEGVANNNRRVSDEHRSSGSDDSESEKTMPEAGKPLADSTWKRHFGE